MKKEGGDLFTGRIVDPDADGGTVIEDQQGIRFPAHGRESLRSACLLVLYDPGQR